MKNKNYANSILFLLITSLILWIATYGTSVGDYYSDFRKHYSWAVSINSGNLLEFIKDYVAYPLWHICVRIAYVFFPTSALNTSAGITALFNCFSLWSVIYVWHRLSTQKLGFGTISIYSLFLLFVGPLSLPAFNEYYYAGQGSGNIWHNPTTIAVKSFAIICFFIIVYLIDAKKTDKELVRTYLLLSFLTLLSVLAKPSFFQGIVPGLGLYFIFILITKGFKTNIKRFLCIAACFIPSACIIGVQFISSFFLHSNISTGAGIGIEFGRVLHAWTPSLLISFLLAFAFPLVVLIINFKKLIQKTAVQVALFYEFMAWCEGAFLYEPGVREGHGNWLWASYLSMFIVWLVFSIYFFDILNDEQTSQKKRILNLSLGVPLLFLHLLFGIAYWYSLSIFS